MSNKLYEEDHIQAIANAIRSMGVEGSWTVAEMPQAIESIEGGGGGGGDYNVLRAGPESGATASLGKAGDIYLVTG